MIEPTEGDEMAQWSQPVPKEPYERGNVSDTGDARTGDGK